MLKKREHTSFQKRLLEWFRQFQRDLPWRRTKDPYRIWLSEIMLQQTRVAAVIPYYERFLQRFPEIQALAEASEQEVLRLWSGLGYYSRARNLHMAAQQIVAQHGGRFPRSCEEILKLSGIGNYTAAAISSIAFRGKQAVLDGNVARVLARLGAVRGDLRALGRWQELQKMANEYLEESKPGEWNQAMMELGATLCTPKSPQCLLCPINEFCEGRKLGIAERLPENRKKRATVEVILAAAVFADKNGWTLLLPPPKGTNQGRLADYVPVLVSNLWHFPTVSVNGNAAANLRSHLKELNVRSRNQRLRLTPAEAVRHSVTYRSITVEPFHIGVKNLPRIPGAERVPLHDVSALPVSNLTRKVARAALAAATRSSQKTIE
jgi:A/G-specific adenine glycosylase